MQSLRRLIVGGQGTMSIVLAQASVDIHPSVISLDAVKLFVRLVDECFFVVSSFR